MLKPLILPFALVAALTACSKSDESTKANVSTAPTNTSQQAPERNEESHASTSQPIVQSEAPTTGSVKNTPEPAAEVGNPKRKEPHAQDAPSKVKSPTIRRWEEFQARVDKCVTAAAGEREACMAEAKGFFQASNFKCNTLAGDARKNCLLFSEQWNAASNDTLPLPDDTSTAVVKSAKEPSTNPEFPSDPRPAERNRDSTKQHDDATETPSDTAKRE
jgi:hypothetical protein